MKYVRCTLRFSESTIHPVHRFIEEHDAMVKDRLLHGNITNTVDTYLFYVEGEMAAYARALDRVPQISGYEITPIEGTDTNTGSETFYAYVKQEPIDTDAELFDAFTRDGIIIVPPVDFLGDGSAHLRSRGVHGA